MKISAATAFFALSNGQDTRLFSNLKMASLLNVTDVVTQGSAAPVRTRLRNGQDSKHVSWKDHLVNNKLQLKVLMVSTKASV